MAANPAANPEHRVTRTVAKKVDVSLWDSSPLWQIAAPPPRRPSLKEQKSMTKQAQANSTAGDLQNRQMGSASAFEARSEASQMKNEPAQEALKLTISSARDNPRRSHLKSRSKTETGGYLSWSAREEQRRSPPLSNRQWSHAGGVYTPGRQHLRHELEVTHILTKLNLMKLNRLSSRPNSVD